MFSPVSIEHARSYSFFLSALFVARPSPHRAVSMLVVFLGFFSCFFLLLCLVLLHARRHGTARHGSLRSTPTTWRRAPEKMARRTRPWVSRQRSRQQREQRVSFLANTANPKMVRVVGQLHVGNALSLISPLMRVHWADQGRRIRIGYGLNVIARLEAVYCFSWWRCSRSVLLLAGSSSLASMPWHGPPRCVNRQRANFCLCDGLQTFALLRSLS